MFVATTETVVLKGGVSVSLDALKVLWNLEDRQFLLSVDGDSLLVQPQASITVADDAAIRQHRNELIALVRYCEVIQ